MNVIKENAQNDSGTSIQNDSPRMFKNDFLEYFSHVSPYAPLVVFIPVVIFFLYKSFIYPGLAWWMTPILFFSGIFIWSFLEYILHRYIFHLEIDTEWGKRLHFFLHGVHHEYPKDETRLVLPPGFSIPMAILFYYLYSIIFPEAYIAALFAGLVMGYLIYDMTHYAIHHYNFKSEWWKKIKLHHMKHHYMDPDSGFGVSSVFWDKIFRTHRFAPGNNKKMTHK